MSAPGRSRSPTRMICGSLVCAFGANGDTEGNLLKEAEADLPERAAAVIPVDDIYFVGLVGDLANLVEDDKMGREATFEFDVVFFVEIGIVDIEVGQAGLPALVQVGEEIGDMRAEQIGAGGLDLVAEHVADDAVEFAIVDCGPKRIFRPGMKPP